MGRWIRFFLLGVLLCLGMAGCSGQNEEEESGYRIWYINKDETRLAYECREMRAENTEGLLNEALEFLREEPEDENYKPPLPEDVRIESYEIEHNQLYLNFSVEYMDMLKVYEVLCRAALVRTLCQIPEIDYIGFRVADQPLMDLRGKAIGLMNEDQFIENAGEEINAYRTADLTLYYTNETGDKLVSQRVPMEYNSNISLEKLIVERLIDGPPYEGAYPTIPANTRLVSVSVRDGICYVNLDAGFLETGYNVTESIPIYSIVNSLIRNTDAQKVQISIDGETNRIFRESISFDTIFERNEELVE
ncbi:MAG: GerMN domain-containing protein [Lachnospiraceae bacterium]|jgi:germination protein M|nr:GerMN domain-containing protein [Lachnospiraceae bacterium]MCI9600890.1 GerMN domain-containing protein [Lachnospiraceae bacterium]